MYAEHFGLIADPFSLTPDPAFLYLSPDHREALAAVQYGLLDGRGFVTLVGEVGTGKTTLLYSILSRRHPKLDAAYVSYSAHRFEDLLASALRDLNIETHGTTKGELLEALNRHLVRHATEDRSTALIIDEAQNLSDETFEELRLLSNFETYTRKLLQIVLVGQPELQERLRQPRLRQLRERVSVRAYVNPLSREQMEKYIAHRLERAGGNVERLFTPAALRTIVRRTDGIPRRANILCHNALLFAYGRALDCVTPAEAREAVAEMDERRSGLLRRMALRRVPFHPSTWRWGAALTGAVVLGLVASQLWSMASPGSQPSSPAHAEGDGAPRAIPAPVAATEAPAAAVPPTAERPATREVSFADVTSDPGTTVAAAPVSEPEPVPAERRVEAVRDESSVAAAVPATIPAAEPGDGLPSATISIVVPRGAALWTILRRVYGDRFPASDRSRLYRRVRELNPQVANVNLIFAGDRLRVPAPPRTGAAVRRGE